MIEQASRADQSTMGWRLKAGIALLVMSVIVPIVGISFVSGLNLSETMVTTVSGAMLIGAELLGVAAVAVMGKPGFLYIKNRVFGFLKQYGPPKEVGRTRYNIGLVMFCVPIVFGWLSPYGADLIPGFIEYPTSYAVIGDLTLLVSLFVLGGDFWDKIRALFVWSEKVSSSS